MSLNTAPQPLPPLGIGAASLNDLAALMHRSLSPEQLARVAARRALVTLKQSCLRAAEDLSGPDAEWLRRRVRLANDSTELWRLRPTIFALLPDDNARSALHRAELNRQLDSVFPESAAEPTVPQPRLSDIPPQLRPR